MRCCDVAERGAWIRQRRPVTQDVTLSTRRGWTSETWTWIFVAAGIFLRILEYSDNRQLYRDETDLKENLVGVAFYDFQTPLTKWQLAPPGFLAVERLMILLPLPFGPRPGWFPSFARSRRCSSCAWSPGGISRRLAVPIAVGLFAVADWMLYYSVELKQYSSDVALTLVVP